MCVAMSVRVQMSLLLVVTTQVSRMVFEEAVSVWKTSVAERKLTFLAVPRTITPLLSVVVAVVAPMTILAIYFIGKRSVQNLLLVVKQQDALPSSCH